MPYEQHWKPAPSNTGLKVHEELPEGIHEVHSFIRGLKEAHGDWAKEDLREFYFCRHCHGWIEGHPNEYGVDNMGYLSGRRGREYFCIRCGKEIAFVGMMA